MHPLCFMCKHYRSDTDELKSGATVYFCQAFPRGGPGIPKEILDGTHDHANDQYPGDNGILFESGGFGPPPK